MLYVCLLAAHWLLGVPWRPWLGLAGAALFVLAVCGFSTFLVGCCIYQFRQAPGGHRPADPPPAPDSRPVKLPERDKGDARDQAGKAGP